ncbi:MAG: hypothetical protein OEQ39_06505 [Gammaproteobacteria bacterium]|nr:hypothetical protein [Gammaproteobacteria bacterium]MDH3465632.1 hypothetical protein [Gammaproteobacteria bacterium]
MAVGVITIESAQAYLDPGTGSLFIQVILGGVAGLLIAGKLFWHRILVFLRIRKVESEMEQKTTDTNDV